MKKYVSDLETDCDDDFVTLSKFLIHLRLDRDPYVLLRYLVKSSVVESTYVSVSSTGTLRLYILHIASQPLKVNVLFPNSS